MTRDKEANYMMIKGSIQEEDITIVNMCAPNIGAPQYIRKTLTYMKAEIDSNTIVVGRLLTAHSLQWPDHQSKINKETQVLNDIFRTFQPNADKYTFFLCAYGTLYRIDHILGHKSHLNKYKKIEIVSSIFSDHNAMRLDVNYKKKKPVRSTYTWRLNNMFLNNQQGTEDTKKSSRNK